MVIKSKYGLKLAGLIISIAIIGASSFIYLLYQSNSNENDYTSTQKRNTPQAENNPKSQKGAMGTTITSGDSEFGPMLFNDKGQAIYIWELEESANAECYGDCAEAWPPVLTDGTPHATGSVIDDLLGTTTRTDGSTQVTYNGHPLYYYAHEGAGEVKCHNVSTHGGLWWVIQPNGTRAD